jgi:hypothetical protein
MGPPLEDADFVVEPLYEAEAVDLVLRVTVRQTGMPYG